MRITYPSPQFPGLPAVALDCPEGWSPLRVAGAQLAVAADVEDGKFRPNIVVVVGRMGDNQTLETTVAAMTEHLSSLDGYEEAKRELAEVAGHPGFRLECAWTDATAGTVAQAVRVAVVEHDGVRDLVQVTGTARGTQVDVVWPWIRTIQDSLTVEV